MLRVNCNLVDVDFPESSEKEVFISTLPNNEGNITYLTKVLKTVKDIFDIVDYNEIENDDYEKTFYEELKELNILNLTHEKVLSIISEFCDWGLTIQTFVKIVFIISGIKLKKDCDILNIKITV